MKPLARKKLWLGFAVVLVPLLLLLTLQYRGLVTIQKTWTLAHKTSLETFLEDVNQQIESFYGQSAERTLKVPAWALREDPPMRLASAHFRRNPPEGAITLFTIRFEKDRMGQPRVYDFQSHIMREAGPSEFFEAATMAASHFWIFKRKAIPIDSPELTVDERDLDHRMILYPLTSPTTQVMGIAGMTLDETYFRDRVLPMAIEKALPRHFADDQIRRNLIVTIRNSEGNLLFSTANAQGRHDEMSVPLAYVFKDWRIGIQSHEYTPEEFARASFTLNVTLSALLALVLVSGILLAIYVTSREMKLSQMKADFVSNVSHELRTPLASIRAFGELLRLGRVSTPEKVRQYGEYIDTESQRLTQLINNILDFSKIESGRKIYRKQAADLKEIVAGTLKALEVSASHQGFQLLHQSPSGPMPRVWVDPSAIALVIHNLIDNAMKYSGESKRVIISEAVGDGWVTVSVEDCGMGISKEQQQKIFERFHRVGTALVHDVKGSGLGLSIVKHVVLAHGGRIGVDSSPGSGSCFTIDLPIAPDTPTDPQLALNSPHPKGT